MFPRSLDDNQIMIDSTPSYAWQKRFFEDNFKTIQTQR